SMLAFFMSGGGYALPDLRVVSFCRPGKAQQPPDNVWNRLHLTLYTPLSEYSLCMIAFLLLLHSLSVKSEICANAMHIN
ncbi:TPA: hypothetical protein ACF2TD_003232, partial [Enterobacter hormaechei]|uniref:hypothetical protein n=1 Tax=Enterobacter hormaechei TaxID=158836 RepID=UPI0021B1F901